MSERIQVGVKFAPNNVVEVTLRGNVRHVSQVLTEGLEPEARAQLSAAVEEGLAKQRAAKSGLTLVTPTAPAEPEAGS